MGTNYYLHRNVCAHCGRGEPPLHIGKSSAGWCFSLRCHPELGLMSLGEWKVFIERSQPGSVIKDEYGNSRGPSELYAVIEDRYRDGLPLDEKEAWANYAKVGPKGLLRHDAERLNARGSGLYWNGEGTWDCQTGEFS